MLSEKSAEEKEKKNPQVGPICAPRWRGRRPSKLDIFSGKRSSARKNGMKHARRW